MPEKNTEMQDKGNLRNKQNKNLAAVQQCSTGEGMGRPGMVLHIHCQHLLPLLFYVCNGYDFLTLENNRIQ